MPSSGDILASALIHCFNIHSNKLSYRFLTKNLDEEQNITFGELAERSQTLAGILQGKQLIREQVLVATEPGISFLVGLVACLFSGAVAIPVPFPHSKRAKERFNTIYRHTAAKAILVDSLSSQEAQTLCASLDSDNPPELIAINQDRDHERLVNTFVYDSKPEDLAFIQYTSGSTGSAKGVMISRDNLLHQLTLISQRFGLTTESVLFSWLPPYHDMGLVGCLLTPLLVGYECNFTSAANFVSQPMMWLQGISRYKATISGGPDFAYALCVDKYQPELMQQLDLSSWKVAFNGAEPVRVETMRRFAQTFAGANFQYSAFQPCYGLAEATLMVSAADISSAPVTINVNKERLEEGIVEISEHEDRVLVSSGAIAQPIEIVSLKNGKPLKDCEVGEIWVTGRSVALGYWQALEEQQQRFSGEILGSQARYFKTGDTGFTLNGQLFITGRLSDLIIVNGKNHYPQHIEYTVENAHEAIKPQGCAAIQTTVNGRDEVVIIAETRTRDNEPLQQAVTAIREAVSIEHGIHVLAVTLVRSGTLLRTSSGKIRRKEIAIAWREQTLQGVLILNDRVSLTHTDYVPPNPGLEANIAHIVQQILKLENIGAHHSFFALGGDSITAMQLSARLEQEYGIEIKTEWIFDHPTIAGLAKFITAELSTGAVREVAEVTSSPMSESWSVLAPAQQRIWFIEQQCGASAAFNEVIKITIEGILDNIALERAFQALYQRHPVLRARFRLHEHNVVQYPDEPLTRIATSSLAELKAKSEDDYCDEERVTRWVSQQAASVINLAGEPPLRVSLLSDNERHWLVITFHHIIFDAWSAHLIARDLSEYYRLALNDKFWCLPKGEIRQTIYTYSAKDPDSKQESQAEEQLSYWLEQLNDFERLDMPTDRQTWPSLIHPSDVIKAAIPGRTIKQLDRLAERHQTTRFVILLSVFYIFLNRYTRQDDLIIGSSVADRDTGASINVVAPLINTLVLRTKLSENVTVNALIGQIKQLVKGALENKSLPFEKLVKHLHIQREQHLHPLFQHAFVLNNTPEPTFNFSGVSAGTERVESGHSLFELFFFIQQTETAFTLCTQYSSALFDRATVNNMVQSWLVLLDAVTTVTNEEDVSIRCLPMLTSGQQTQLLVDFNDTDAPLISSTIPEVVARYVWDRPDHTALEHNDETMSYRQLHEASDKLAAYLTAEGFTAGKFVAIGVKRSIAFFVSVMGVLKAGAAFLPLDNGQPQERIRRILEESGAALFIADPMITEPIVNNNNEANSLLVLRYDDLCARAEKLSRNIVLGPIHPLQPAYLIYTSGSTGVPKGVVVEHASVINLALWQRDYFALTPDSRISQFATTSFDGAIGEMVMALLSGCTLVLLDRDNVEPDVLIETLNQQAINVAVFVPSLLKLLNPAQLNRNHDLTIVSVGEICPPSLAQQWRAHCRFINGYGPTEGTVYSHASDIGRPDHQGDAEFNANSRVSVGFPMANVRSCILDDGLQLVPQGAIGELYFSGANLACGYHNRPSLTAERFLPAFYDADMPLPKKLILAESAQAIEEFKKKWLIDSKKGRQRNPAEEEHLLEHSDMNSTVSKIFSTLPTNGIKQAWRRYFLESDKGSYKAEGLTEQILQTLLDITDFSRLQGADFGFGNGEVLARLTQMGAVVKGLDYIPGFINAARQVGLQAELARIDAPWETFTVHSGISKGSLDFAISTLVLDRVVDPQQFLNNVNHSLRAGGHFALQTLLPVVPVDDNLDVYNPIEYTPQSLHIVKGNNIIEDARDLKNLLETIFRCDVQLYRFPYVVLSRDGLQEYDVWSFTGAKQVKHSGNHAGNQHTRMYKTGDLARYRSDGSIEILGRTDRQVKLRGFRVELEEIEVALKQYEGVIDAAVDIRSLTNRERDTTLIAWIVPSDANSDFAKSAGEQLRRHLQTTLPNFMWPSQYVLLEALPYSVSGKLDRKQLATPVYTAEPTLQTTTVKTLPANTIYTIEETLLEVAREVLAEESVQVNDNLFELGLDSIMIIQMVSRLRKKNIVLAIEQFFEHQTIGELAILANVQMIEAEKPASAVLLHADFPLTPIQRWYVAQSTNPFAGYNQSAILHLKKNLSSEQVSRAVASMLMHHPMLTTRLVNTTRNEWLQHYDPHQSEQAFVLCHVPEKEDIDTYCDQILASANTAVRADGQLAQFRLVNAHDHQRLIVVIHHLVTDVISWSVMLNDLQTYLSSSDQPENILPEQGFAEWARYLDDYARQESLETEFYYWQGLLGAVKSLPIVTEAVRYHHNSCQKSLHFSASQTARLQTFSRNCKVSLQDCLIAALAKVLCQVSGTNRVLMDIETHGRQFVPAIINTEQAVGWFTCLFPLVLDIAQGQSAEQQVGEIAKQHQQRRQHGLSYGVLRYGSQQAIMQALPQSMISFNHLGNIDTLLPEHALFTQVDIKTQVSIPGQQKRPYALELISFERNQQLSFELTFDQYLDEQSASQLLTLLEAVINGFIGQEEQAQLEVDEQPDVMQLTPVQHGMLLHCLANPSSGVYLNQLSVDLCGQLDFVRFKQAWQRVVTHYAALRVGFRWQDRSEPVQFITPESHFAVIELDWRSETAEQREYALTQLLRNDRQRGFDLCAPPLMRLHIIRLDDELHKMIWTFHHLLLDGWSVALVFKALYDSYNQLVAGETHVLPAVPSFQSQLSWVLNQSAQDNAEFWQQTLKDAFVMPLLSGDNGPKQDNGSKQKDNTEIKLPGEQSHILSSEQRLALERFCREQRLTINSVIAGVWGLLIARDTGEKQALFGVTLSGRTVDMPQMEHCVGMFINTVPLLVKTDLPMSVKVWLSGVQRQQIALQSVQFSPLSDVIRWSGLPRGEQPYQSVILFENYPLDSSLQQVTGALRFENANTLQQSNYPLMLVVIPTDPFVIQLNYETERFKASYIRLLLERFLILLNSVINNVDQPLSAVCEWTEWDKKIYQQINHDTLPFDFEAECLQDRFARQAAVTPDRVAVHAGGEQLTYAELNRKSNQFSHYLQQAGIGPEIIVGLCVTRSLDMYVGLLAILKAGGAYLPLDPNLPASRIKSIVSSAGIQLILAHTATQSSVADVGGEEVLLLDKPNVAVVACPENNPTHGGHAENLAYVMFTSGSTGTPKGVMGTHRSTQNCLEWMWRDAPFLPDEVCCQKTAYNFGDSIQEIFGPLLQGVMTIVIDNDTLLSSTDFIAELQHHRVTRIVLVPSLLRFLLDSGENLGERLAALRYWLVSGEALPDSLSAEFYRQLPETRLLNMYGASELSNDVTLYTIPPSINGNSYSPIGRPIANMTVHLLDRDLRPVPVGIVGEIYVGGPGVNRGYLGSAGLTAGAFIPDPFSSQAGARMYKTGDLGFINDDAQLVFSGRADQQIKLRGFRIELDEIIHAIEQHAGIKQCFVTTIVNQRKEEQIVAAVELTRIQQLLHDKHSYLLPNNLVVLHHTKAETDYIWMEIFASRDYMQHGIVVNPGDVVVDIGANIGLFTLFAHYELGASVYAIEPDPENAELLKKNHELHSCKGKVFAVGCGAAHERRQFTRYKGSSLTSGFFADTEIDSRIVKAAAAKSLTDAGRQQVILAETIDELIASRMMPQQIELEVVPLSAILAEIEEPVINLLKVDVERAELDVLAGIAQQDWPRIRQIVLEVENENKQLSKVTSLLTEQGYSLIVDKSGHFPEVDMYMVYAIRNDEEVVNRDNQTHRQSAELRYANAPVRLDISAGSLRQYISERLPNYMVPASIEIVGELEKTSSGKVNRNLMKKRLQEAANHKTHQVIPPQNATETVIAQVWSESLKVPSVGREDNFFDLGGHSLLVIAVCNEITKRSGTALSFIDLFRYPTVSQLAAHMTGAKQNSFDGAFERGQRRQYRRRVKRPSGTGE
ncbi:non-ribosomal peptide synthetase [Xenorhabdus bovienii]|uniref:non-ribosomal peptide synthetase n=2 Tax=Xenorhabdus bovienii TaxID=40576 RepID=UPI0023B311C6|nr:non-ribosomal peptide synthetase [Xenorhabdus bovienii]MDE9528727.1 amino acid adenylation domain-containing protein [Xenorhabdus bovienii]